MNRDQFRGITLAALMVLSVFSVVAVSPATAAGTTSVSVNPQSQSVQPTQTVEYDIVVDDADGGVGAYDITVSTSSASSATITGISQEIGATPQTTSKSWGANNASVTLATALGDTDQSGSVTIATVEVTGQNAGTSADLNVQVNDLTDEAANSYTVSSVNDGVVNVQQAPQNAAVSVTNQTTLGDSITVDSINTGQNGTHIAVWSLDDQGNPDTALASKNVGTGYSNNFEVFTGLGLADSQTVAVTVHDGTPAEGNIEASDLVGVTFVEADITDSSPGDAPTYWQGQVVVLESAGGQTFTGGQEYQVRSMSKQGGPNGQQWQVDPGPVQEIRATGNNELIVRSQNLPADAYAVESNGSPLAAGDTPGDANSLSGIPNYAWEVAVQDLDITPQSSEVVDGNTLEVEVQSNRAGFDATAYWNGTYVDHFNNLGNFEDVDVQMNVLDGWRGNTEDLTFVVNDTTATDSEPVTVLPPAVSNLVETGAQITEVEPDQTGDMVTINLDYSAQSTQQNVLRTWTLVGGPGDRILDLLNVTDVNDDGEATIVVNSFVMGRGDPAAGVSLDAGYTALGNDTVNVTRPRHFTDVPGATSIAGPSGSEQVWGHEAGAVDPEDFDSPPRAGIATPLGSSSYELTTMSQPLINLSQDETALAYPYFADGDSLTLQERSTEEDMNVYVAPRGINTAFLDSQEDIQSNATLVSESGEFGGNVVANGDVVILEIQASGLDGYVHNLPAGDGINDLLMPTVNSGTPNRNLAFSGSNGVHMWVAQQETPASGDRYYWDLARDASLIADGEDDTYYVRVPTDRLSGVGTRSSEAPPNTGYEANMIVFGGQSSDFWEEGDFPDDPNFLETGDSDAPGTFDVDESPYLPDQGDGQEFASGQISVSQRMVKFDQFVQNTGDLRVNANANVTLSGTTVLAPGSQFRLSLRNTSTALTEDVAVTVTSEDGERVWSTSGIDLSDQDAGTPFLTWALERGLSITSSAQATVPTSKGDAVPSMVGAVPTASVTMDDQQARDSGTLVTVHDVQLNKPGFVAIHRGSASGEVIGVSGYLEAGSHSNVNVRLETALDSTTTLVAMPHLDTNDNRVYDFSADPSEDTPFTEDGAPVTDDASVSIPTPTPTPTTTTPTPTTTTPTPTTTTPTPTTTTPTPTTTTPTPTTTTPTTTEGDGPGFGVIVALMALIAAALLAVRRKD